MRTTLVAKLVPALALGVLAVCAEAQQHRATRLGNPATRFGKPIRQADDVRVLLRGDTTKADVATILNEVGWKGSVEDLDRAAAAATISSIRVPTGTQLPFMASRSNGRPHALVNVLWAGRKPIDALAFEFASNCERYRFVTPRACSNFWIENLGKDATDPKCAARPAASPLVSLSGAAEACVAQPVEYAVRVQNPLADSRVTLQVNGQEIASGRLANGAFKYAYAGAPSPGSYEVKATSGGVSSTTTLRVRPCPPTCSITASPRPAKAGRPLTVDLSGSRVAAGVRGGFKSARVDLVDARGLVVDTFELGAGLRRSDITLRKGGTLRAAVTDEAGQISTNTCEVQAQAPAGLPFFLGAYAGKERLVQEEPFYPSGRCAALIGAEIGIQPRIAEHTELEAAFGVKFNLRDSENSSIFGDVAVNRILGKAFLGAGLSGWDLLESDTRRIALLLQGGFDLTKDGKWQLVAQGRAPFSEMSDLADNYVIWGGFRFRPSSAK